MTTSLNASLTAKGLVVDGKIAVQVDKTLDITLMLTTPDGKNATVKPENITLRCVESGTKNQSEAASLSRLVEKDGVYSVTLKALTIANIDIAVQVKDADVSQKSVFTINLFKIPTVEHLVITDNNDKEVNSAKPGDILKARYHYNDNNAGLQERIIQWYFSREQSGSASPISSATKKTFTPRAEHAGGYISYGVTPAGAVDKSLKGPEVSSTSVFVERAVVVEAAPYVTDVVITGSAEIDRALKASSIYHENGAGKEEYTHYQWYYYDEESKSWKESHAQPGILYTGNTFTPHDSSYVGLKVRVGAIAKGKDSDKKSSEKYSDPSEVIRDKPAPTPPPSVQSVRIAGNQSVGGMLTAKFDLHGSAVDAVAEWFWTTNEGEAKKHAGKKLETPSKFSGHNNIQCTPGPDDFLEYIYVTVTPMDNKGKKGTPVPSEPVQITGVTPSVSDVHIDWETNSRVGVKYKTDTIDEINNNLKSSLLNDASTVSWEWKDTNGNWKPFKDSDHDRFIDSHRKQYRPSVSDAGYTVRAKVTPKVSGVTSYDGNVMTSNTLTIPERKKVRLTHYKIYERFSGTELSAKVVDENGNGVEGVVVVFKTNDAHVTGSSGSAGEIKYSETNERKTNEYGETGELKVSFHSFLIYIKSIQEEDKEKLHYMDRPINVSDHLEAVPAAWQVLVKI